MHRIKRTDVNVSFGKWYVEGRLEGLNEESDGNGNGKRIGGVETGRDVRGLIR